MNLTQLLEIWVEAEGPGGVKAGARGERGALTLLVAGGLEEAVCQARAGPYWRHLVLLPPGQWPLHVVPACEPGLGIHGLLWRCPEGPPPTSRRLRQVLSPPTLAGLGLGDRWLQGVQGCHWPRGAEGWQVQ